MPDPASHPRPFYYLDNFRTALNWLRERYGDVLKEDEHAFIDRFQRVPRESAALLVRMIGRKGTLFRTDKLRYAEIGCPLSAGAALIESGWVNDNPTLTVSELGRLLRKSELQHVLGIGGSSQVLRKARLLESVATLAEPRILRGWWPEAPVRVFRLEVSRLCERLRLLFFGNFRQDWSEFVLTDLGIFRYEKVSLDRADRAFQTQQHLDIFHALFECRQALDPDPPADVDRALQSLPPPVTDNEWLEGRRRKLQFRIAQHYEQRREFRKALSVYRDCPYGGSRIRMTRLLERTGQIPEALALATDIRSQPRDETESQLIERIWPRLQRKSGVVPQRRCRQQRWPEFGLVLAAAARPPQLEKATAQALSQSDAPAHYVENGLLNSLFGLLCWEAIFAAIPGAFFHEFQSGPADLHAPDFRQRRSAQFAHCLGQLEGTGYHHTIRRNFLAKRDIQSPFVFWGLLDETLLDRALECLPARHLQACFQRILSDIRANRSGLPDLVQFWPRERRYRLIEVKGPGDRLQDNQIRWLGFFREQQIPVTVCHVSWAALT